MPSDIVGAIQRNRKGLGKENIKLFYRSSAKDRRDAVVNKVNLVQCSQQGQCVSGKEHVVGRKLFESCPVAPHSVWLPHGPESAVHLVAQPRPKGRCGCYRIKDKRDQSRQTTCERMPGKSDVFFNH